MTRIPAVRFAVILATALIGIALAVWACDRWGVQSDPCLIDAPMEQAQCRAVRP